MLYIAMQDLMAVLWNPVLQAAQLRQLPLCLMLPSCSLAVGLQCISSMSNTGCHWHRHCGERFDRSE